MATGHKGATVERLEQEREEIADVRRQLAAVDDIAARAQEAIEKGDRLLGDVDRGLEITAEAATKARNMAPRVAFIALGVVGVVAVVIVIRKRRAARDDNLD